MPLKFAQCFIPDDPESRRQMVTGIVKKYCTNILFPSNGNVQPHKSAEGGNGDAYQSNENGPVNCIVNGNENGKIINGGNINHEVHSLTADRLSGGITNELFHVYCPLDLRHSVVFRVFGKETERVISRESELFYQSFFIPTYVRGTNFLIYEFLNDHETLPFTHMLTEYEKIAYETAAFQVKATLEARCDYHSPLVVDEASLMYWDSISPILGGVNHLHHRHPSDAVEFCRFDREENYTMHSFTKWVEQMLSESIRNKVGEERREEYDSVARQLEEEVKWVTGIIATHAQDLGESVCHNDLLSANIMRNTINGSLKIIDFDYAKRNYLLFDLANHFNEYTGLECDYKRYFPTDEQMAKFIVCYRASMRDLLQRHAEEAARRELEDIIPNQKKLFFCADEEEEEQTVARWVRLVKFLTLASHLSWSIWALLQEAVSALDMDFLEYSKLRLARYLETKVDFSVGFV